MSSNDGRGVPQVERAFAPIFSQQAEVTDPVASGGAPPEVARTRVASIKTYRYLRLGMLVTVAALTAAIVGASAGESGLLTSLSAYYYTPARAVYDGGLFAIGLSLNAIKGRNAFEDFCLNLAGMLAPLVALVPTTDRGGKEVALLQADLDAAANNVQAILIAGFFATLLAVGVTALDQRNGELASDRTALRARVALLVLTVVTLAAVTYVFAAHRDFFLEHAHGKSAFVMFGVLALASVGNGVVHLRGGSRAYAVTYLGIGIAMVGVGCLMVIGSLDGWERRTLWVEMIEIALFAALWTVQTWELWGEVVPRPETSTVVRRSTSPT